MTSNQIEFWKLQETQRHNVAKLKEDKRHNKVEEGIAKEQLQYSKKQAEAASLRAETEAKYADSYATASMLTAQANAQRAASDVYYAGTYASAASTNAGASWLNAYTTSQYASQYADAATRQANASLKQIDVSYSRLAHDIWRDTAELRIKDEQLRTNKYATVGNWVSNLAGTMLNVLGRRSN